MGSSGSKTESGPRSLEGWEVDLFARGGDLMKWIGEEYPFEDTITGMEGDLSGLINTLLNVPNEIKELIAPYLGIYDQIDASLKGYASGLINNNQLLSNTIASLGGLSKQISNNQGIYDKRMAPINKMYFQDKEKWSKFAATAERDLSSIKSSLPIVNIHGISLRPPAHNSVAARDRQVGIAGEGMNAANQGMQSIAQGSMDTRLASQGLRSDIIGNMIPGAINSRSANFVNAGNTQMARAENANAGINAATLPQQYTAQLTPQTAELMGSRYNMLMDPINYLQQLQLTRAGQNVSSQSQKNGFGVQLGPVGFQI